MISLHCSKSNDSFLGMWALSKAAFSSSSFLLPNQDMRTQFTLCEVVLVKSCTKCKTQRRTKCQNAAAAHIEQHPNHVEAAVEDSPLLPALQPRRQRRHLSFTTTIIMGAWCGEQPLTMLGVGGRKKVCVVVGSSNENALRKSTKQNE